MSHSTPWSKRPRPPDRQLPRAQWPPHPTGHSRVSTRNSAQPYPARRLGQTGRTRPLISCRGHSGHFVLRATASPRSHSARPCPLGTLVTNHAAVGLDRRFDNLFPRPSAAKGAAGALPNGSQPSPRPGSGSARSRSVRGLGRPGRVGVDSVPCVQGCRGDGSGAEPALQDGGYAVFEDVAGYLVG